MTTLREARRLAAGLFFLALFSSVASAQDDAASRLKERLNDLDPVGSWFYDDLGAAYVEARKTGRPMMVVFR